MAKTPICGIYAIVNTENGHRYIGQAVNIHDRWVYHKWALMNKTHDNPHLQRAWNKYGPDAFVHCIVEICDEDLLNERETFWINETPKEERYNILLIAGDGRRGIPHTPETRAKMRTIKKNIGQETRAKMSTAARNRSPEARANLSAARKGIVFSPEWRANMSASRKGKTGDLSHHKKITQSDADAIRELLNQGIYQTDIAKQFGVGKSTVCRIAHNKNWKQQENGENITPCKYNTKGGRSKLTQEDVDAIRELLAQGVQQKKIAMQFGISSQNISSIAHGRSWKTPKQKEEES